MKYRILTGMVVIPLLIVLTTTPAYAIFGSILAGIQRAQMIINQGVQIYEAQAAVVGRHPLAVIHFFPQNRFRSLRL